VLAVTPVELLALDRHHFVEAVTGQAASALAADEVIHAHLHRDSDEPNETDARA